MSFPVMNALRSCSVLALLLLPGLATAKPPETRTVDAAITKSMKTWSVPGASVVVVLDGKAVHLKGYGVRESGKDGEVTPDTLFCLASCGKAFTTAAMAALVDDGKLNWDDRVRDHLPGFRLSDDLASRDVRLRDLVCHRTGLAANDLIWYRAPWTPEEGVARLEYLPLAKPFRSAFQYNSVTFTAAGLAAARAGKTTWPELIQKRLLDPLEMKRTVLDATTADKDDDRARSHRLDRTGDAQSYATVSMLRPDPAGSIHSSARDLANWLNFHLEVTAGGKRIVSARSLRQTHTPQMVIHHSESERALFPGTLQTSYAMGWVVLDHDSHKLLAHGGAMDGQRVQIILVPGKKLGIAVLANLERTPMTVALAFTLLDLYLGVTKKRYYDALHQTARKQRAIAVEKSRRERLASQQADTKPSRELNAYSGTYEHKAFGKVQVRLVRGRLVWEYRGDTHSLEHFHHDTFLVAGELPGDAELTFALDERGNVKRMAVTGNLNATFQRAEK